MNTQILKYWNTFMNANKINEASNLRTIFYTSTAPWNLIKEKAIHSLILPLSEFDNTGNTLPSVLEYVLLLDEQFEPKAIVQITSLEILASSDLDQQMLQSSGNQTKWLNYYQKDHQQALGYSENRILYIEFNLIQ